MAGSWRIECYTDLSECPSANVSSPAVAGLASALEADHIARPSTHPVINSCVLAALGAVCRTAHLSPGVFPPVELRCCRLGLGIGKVSPLLAQGKLRPLFRTSLTYCAGCDATYITYGFNGSRRASVLPAASTHSANVSTCVALEVFYFG